MFTVEYYCNSVQPFWNSWQKANAEIPNYHYLTPIQNMLLQPENPNTKVNGNSSTNAGIFPIRWWMIIHSLCGCVCTVLSNPQSRLEFYINLGQFLMGLSKVLTGFRLFTLKFGWNIPLSVLLSSSHCLKEIQVQSADRCNRKAFSLNAI